MKTQKQQNKFIDDMIEFFNNVSDEDRVDFASTVAFNAALYGGYNHAESMGILECSKLDLQEAWKDVICEECRENENKERKLGELN